MSHRLLSDEDEEEVERVDGARLQVQHSFGARLSSIRDAVKFIGDQGFLYPVGKYVAQYDNANQFQSLVYEQPAAVQEITALAISPNLKYLAVCELHSAGGPNKLPGKAHVTIIFLPTRRLIRTLYHTIDGPITCAEFSHDSKFVACQLGAPEHACCVWSWEKGKLLGSFKSRTAVSRLRFHPEQSGMLSLSAPMRLVRVNEKGHFKDVELPSLRKLAEVHEHCWLGPSRLLVLTVDGLAHVFVSGEYAYATRWWQPSADGALSSASALSGLSALSEVASSEALEPPPVAATDSAEPPARAAEVVAQPSELSEGTGVPPSTVGSAKPPHTPRLVPPFEVTCMCPCAQGVLVGTTDGSALLLIEDPPGSRLRLAAAIRLDTRTHAVLGITLSPSEADVMLQFADNQMCVVSLRSLLRSLGIERSNVVAGEALAGAGTMGGGRAAATPSAALSRGGADGGGQGGRSALVEVGYDLLFSGVHSGAIAGLATAVGKPIFATCSDDGTVRVQSYTSPRVSLLCHTPEDGVPLSLALHPLGSQLALVRKDRISLLEVGIDSLWPSRELHISHASLAAYSSGGAYLAVVCGSAVHVYSSFSGEHVAKLMGTGVINALSWSADDVSLSAAGSDGMAYRWHLHDGCRLEEHHTKGTSYHAVALVMGVRPPAKEPGASETESGGRQGAGGYSLEHEQRSSASRESRGIVDSRARPFILAVGTDHKLRLISSGDVTELVVHQTNLLPADAGAPSAAGGEQLTASGQPGVGSSSRTSHASGAAGSAAAAARAAAEASLSLVCFTALAAMHKCPVVFAGTASGAIHVFAVEMRARDTVDALNERDARAERKQDAGLAAPAVGSGSGGNVRLASSFGVVSVAGAGRSSAVAVLVAGSPGARAWQAHNGRVGQLSVTIDDAFLLSAAEDGSVFVFSVTLLMQGQDRGSQPVPLASLSLSDVVSVGRRTVDELRTQLAEATLAASERGLNLEAAVARVEIEWRDRSEVRDRVHAASLARLERLHGEAHASRTADASAFAKRLAALSQHADNSQREASSHLEGALKLEIERAQALEAHLATERGEAATRAESLRAQLVAEKAAAAEAAEAQASALEHTSLAASSALEQQQLIAEQSSHMVEEEHEGEVAELRKAARDELAALAAEASQLRVDRMVARNQLAKLQTRIDELESKIALKLASLAQAKERTDALERQLAVMHSAVEVREREIGDRDRAYHDLSETAVKLVNCRDMLDSRVSELEATERISEVERRDLRAQASSMLKQLQDEARRRETAELELKRSRQQLEAAAQQFKGANQRCSAFEGRLFVLGDELSRIVESSSRHWDHVTKLLRMHADNPAPQHPPHFEAAALNEVTRHRGQAELESNRLRARLAHSRVERDSALRVQKFDNAELLVEMNALRRENHRLKRSLSKAKDMVVQHLSSRHEGELAIERSSLFESLGSVVSDDDDDDISDAGGDASGHKRAHAARLSEQELELRALREQVSFFLTQPLAPAGAMLPDTLGSPHGGSGMSGAATRRIGLARGPTTHQPAVRWERSGNTMLRKTVPLPPV